MQKQNHCAECALFLSLVVGAPFLGNCVAAVYQPMPPARCLLSYWLTQSTPRVCTVDELVVAIASGSDFWNSYQRQ
jgi:hypothetical protein